MPRPAATVDLAKLWLVTEKTGRWVEGVRAPLQLVVDRDREATEAWIQIAESLTADGWQVPAKPLK